MLLSGTSRTCRLKCLVVLPALISCLLACGCKSGYAQSATSAEQVRLSIVRVLQKKISDTNSSALQEVDELSIPGNDGVAQAIPFNRENETNSADVLAIGKKMWQKKFKGGKSFSNCFANGGKRVAATYPQFDPNEQQVVTLEMALNRCLALHGEPEIAAGNTVAISPLLVYVRSLSEGVRISIRVPSEAALEKFVAGKTLFARRIGQANFACASCHLAQAGQRFGISPDNGTRARFINLSPVTNHATSWPKLEPGGTLRTLQMQFQHCMRRSGAEAFDIGADDLNNLEYFYTYLSNGLPIRTLTVHR
jgi:L-cysteine S-thiosulfotransferase